MEFGVGFFTLERNRAKITVWMSHCASVLYVVINVLSLVISVLYVVISNLPPRWKFPQINEKQL